MQEQVSVSSTSATPELPQSSVNNIMDTLIHHAEVELNQFFLQRAKVWECLVNNPELLQKSIQLAKEEYNYIEEREGEVDWAWRSTIIDFCPRATLALEQERRAREQEKLAKLREDQKSAEEKRIQDEEEAKKVLLKELHKELNTQAYSYYTLSRLQTMVGIVKGFNKYQKGQKLNEKDFQEFQVGNSYATPILVNDCINNFENLEKTVMALKSEVATLREQVSDLHLRLAVPSRAGSEYGGSHPATPRSGHATPTHQPDSTVPPIVYSGVGIQEGLELGDQPLSQAYYTNEQARCAMQETRQQYGLAEHPLVLPTPDYEPKSHQAMNTPARPQTPKRPPADHTFHKVDSSTSYSSSYSSNPNPNPNPNPPKKRKHRHKKDHYGHKRKRQKNSTSVQTQNHDSNPNPRSSSSTSQPPDSNSNPNPLQRSSSSTSVQTNTLPPDSTPVKPSTLPRTLFSATQPLDSNPVQPVSSSTSVQPYFPPSCSPHVQPELDRKNPAFLKVVYKEMKRKAQTELITPKKLPVITDKTWDTFEYYFVENNTESNTELHKFFCWHSQYKKFKRKRKDEPDPKEFFVSESGVSAPVPYFYYCIYPSQNKPPEPDETVNMLLKEIQNDVWRKCLVY